MLCEMQCWDTRLLITMLRTYSTSSGARSNGVLINRKLRQSKTERLSLETRHSKTQAPSTSKRILLFVHSLIICGPPALEQNHSRLFASWRYPWVLDGIARTSPRFRMFVSGPHCARAQATELAICLYKTGISVTVFLRQVAALRQMCYWLHNSKYFQF